MEPLERRATDREQEVHERRRAEILETIPTSYRPWVHLFIPSAFGLAVCLIAAALVRAPQAWELAVFPVSILLGWGFEWRVHKSVLHHPRPGLRFLYVQHEQHHHVIYRHDDMAMRSMRELALILMPPYAIVIVFVMVVPLAAALARFGSQNAALVFLVAAMTFFLAYEWLHFAYHLPPTSAVARSGLLDAMRELHRRHHDPALMKRWNFNVTVPLFDWLYGTLWSPARQAARDARRPGVPAGR